jgi:hypothetical protein
VESTDNAVVFTDHCVFHYEFNAFVEIPKTKSRRFVYNYKNRYATRTCICEKT